MCWGGGAADWSDTRQTGQTWDRLVRYGTDGSDMGQTGQSWDGLFGWYRRLVCLQHRLVDWRGGLVGSGGGGRNGPCPQVVAQR